MQGHKERILLVDDEPTLLQLGERLLTTLGYEVISATTGSEACQLYREQKDRIQLVILDFLLPGMNGEETFHELKKIDSNVRVLLASGLNQEGRPQKLMSQGVQGFIRKPFMIQDLSDAVRGALDAPLKQPLS